MSDKQNKNGVKSLINESVSTAIPIEDDALDAATGGAANDKYSYKLMAIEEGRTVGLSKFASVFMNGQFAAGTNFDCTCDLDCKYAMVVNEANDGGGKRTYKFSHAKCYNCGQTRNEISCCLQ